MQSSPASVLRLITRLNIGGPAIQALLLTRRLADTHPTILAAGAAPAEEGELADPRVSVVRVPLVRTLSPPTDLAAYRAVRRLIEASGVSLVHTHMAKAGIVGRVAALRTRRPVRTVHTFHGHVLEGYFSAPAQWSFIAVERWLAARTDALVAVSHEVRDSLLGMGIGSLERFHVIPLGFDLSPFLAVSGRSGALRAPLGIGEEIPLIGVVGRLAAIKDHATVLRAIARIPDAHLVILGDGDRRMETERAIDRLGVSDRVHLMGWRLDIAACLADMDVVTLTSRNEGTPVSLIEASAASKPVVATDVGGVRSVVIDGETGFLVRVSDDEMLAARISQLLAEPELARRLGMAGREYVRNRFDQDRLVADIRTLYDSVIGPSS